MIRTAWVMEAEGGTNVTACDLADGTQDDCNKDRR